METNLLMKSIPLEKQIEDFKQYLDSSSRMVLSARFGDGKTYFLQKFKEKYAKKYYYITIHPVNYSVSSNDDIFEYIKRDVLLQLTKDGKLKNLDIGKICKSMFSRKNIYRMLSFLVEFMPKGDKINEMMESLKEIKAEYEKQKGELGDYFDSFTSMKGSIYENDVYTHTIEEAVLAIHEEGNKTVLIVEDLDRIDPKHLFRLLNIISAHMDAAEDYTNKFGFDNIVLVMDYEMTRHIFHHFYGEKANYEGYMCKFLSCEPFRYSLQEVANSLLNNHIQKKIGLEDIIEQFANMKRRIDSLSLRDYTHIRDFDINSRIKEETFVANDFIFSTNLPFFPLLAYMIELGLNKHEIIEDLSLKTDYAIKDIENHIKLLFPVFMVHNSPIEGCSYKGQKFKVKFVFGENRIITDMKVVGNIEDENLFELNDSNVKLALNTSLKQISNAINLSSLKDI